MILLPSAAQRIAAIPFLFRAHACLDETGLYALSYGRKVYGVFTRTGAAAMQDQTGRLVRVAGGQPRVGRVRTAAGVMVPTLAGEHAGENLCVRSEEFDHASWTKSGVTVTANAALAPDGRTTMDLLTPAATTSYVLQTVTVTGDGEKVFSVFLRQGSASSNQVLWYDSTAGVGRHVVNVSWTAGIPSLATGSGSGTLYAPVWYYGEGWRIAFSATGVVAANVNQVVIYPDRVVGTNTVYAWGAQAENAVVPSSYTPTTSAAASRSGETLYFDCHLPPQALTAYVNAFDLGTTRLASARFLQLSSAANVAPRLILLHSSPNVSFLHDPDGSSVSSGVGVTHAIGAELELRGLLASTGAVTMGLSVNRGAETLGTPSAADPLQAAWSGPRVYLAGQSNALNAYRAVAIAPGAVARDVLRDLCEVG